LVKLLIIHSYNKFDKKIDNKFTKKIQSKTAIEYTQGDKHSIEGHLFWSPRFLPNTGER